MVRLIILAFIGLFPIMVNAYPITSYLEMVKESSVSNTWKTLTLDNTYTNPVVACTYNLASSGNNEGSARVRVVNPATIQVKVQRPLNGAVTASDVYCTISEEGSYTTPIKYEAHTVVSTDTNRKSQWQIARTENVTSAKVQTYTNPVVTGQVMTDNNANFVTFWSSACNRGNPATNAAICVGKHTAETNITTAFTETIGYFIAEQAEYTLVNARVKIALGADSIQGVDNSAPDTYSLLNTYTYATATLSAMDGGDGGWAVLYGSNPVSSTINISIDEDTVSNTERSHTTEQVAYWVMEPIIHPELSLQKTVSTIYDPFNVTTNPKSIPGSVLEYTITGTNSGDGPADDGSIVIMDLVPENTKLCVANVGNCLAPYFSNGTPSSGLSLSAINYSNNNAVSYAYSAAADAEGADGNITNLQATTSDSFLPQTGVSAPNFSISFRVIVE